ncbi:2OG-Fe(II) oxygenase [Vibrio sp. D404a]|uniref:2OG-Fe(II) oxygenase n=1 Tax=unclassified Vibrio TaxID=2614977 RepID=UPI002553AC87|nr:MULTISPECIES: 2OG-Fe(II) oxygenase [unclassified Vibrio]MDK9735728.1 2OG-Fe(II) oxygenase [Vibrio sp. D404a]MDK9798644.1 2OG-Fe(II) oxygenase [Vibrio sp. D449a]
MTLNQLQQARDVQRPTREAMLQRAPEVHTFWNNNRTLFQNAWGEWEKSQSLAPLTESLIDHKLRNAINSSWADPTKEDAVKDLLSEVAPGVFKFQFFDVESIKQLRSYLSSAASADIPLRPPYGIALNRGGAMLDERSEGYLAAPSFQTFYREMLDKYMRPIARLLFPEIVGYDAQTFGFSIRYQPNTDTSLRMHTDASSVTLNINMNLPEETFSGSEVSFYDPTTGGLVDQTFEPGVALIHRGHVPHATDPITQGERSNLVLWLYGNRGQIPMQDVSYTSIDATQRWTTPTNNRDAFAPF